MHYFRIKYRVRMDGNPHLNQNEWRKGQWLENKEFEHSDENGDKCLCSAWKREVEILNGEYPQLEHRIEEHFGDLSLLKQDA